MPAADKTKSCQYKAGFGKAVITPPEGISLAGYFEPRPNTGKYDDLYVRAFVVTDGETTAGILMFDLCLMPRVLVLRVREAVRKAGLAFADNLICAAIHTHTGPDVGGLFRTDKDYPDYIESIVQKAGAAAKQAAADLVPAECYLGGVEHNPFAYVRRYWMKDGRVVTNPGKCNPEVVKPEGEVDRQVNVLAVKSGGKTRGLLVNLSNHTDTIGGDKVSADWPGAMERTVQKELGDVPVLTLVAPQGDINHFDIGSDVSQTNYEEACRIGEGYGKIVLGVMPKLKPIKPGKLSVASCEFEFARRDIPQEKIDEAKALLATEAGESGAMTSEDLAKGAGGVMRIFAKSLLKFEELKKDGPRTTEVQSLRFGHEFAIHALPGEPFTGIGKAIREQAKFGKVFIASLANDHCGYTCMPECYQRGGYEILPTAYGGCREDFAETLIKVSLELLNG
jgi:hypothetical protein